MLAQIVLFLALSPLLDAALPVEPIPVQQCWRRAETWRNTVTFAVAYTGSHVTPNDLLALMSIETCGDPGVYRRMRETGQPLPGHGNDHGAYSIQCRENDKPDWRSKWKWWLRQTNDPVLAGITCATLDGSSRLDVFRQTVAVIHILGYMCDLAGCSVASEALYGPYAGSTPNPNLQGRIGALQSARKRLGG